MSYSSHRVSRNACHTSISSCLTPSLSYPQFQPLSNQLLSAVHTSESGLKVSETSLSVRGCMTTATNKYSNSRASNETNLMSLRMVQVDISFSSKTQVTWGLCLLNNMACMRKLGSENMFSSCILHHRSSGRLNSRSSIVLVHFSRVWSLLI